MLKRLPYVQYDIKAAAHLVQCLPESGPIMSSVELHETEQCVFFSPLPNSTFLDPVPSDCKVSIHVGGLPCVTCEAYFTRHDRALKSCS